MELNFAVRIDAFLCHNLQQNKKNKLARYACQKRKGHLTLFQ